MTEAVTRMRLYVSLGKPSRETLDGPQQSHERVEVLRSRLEWEHPMQTGCLSGARVAPLRHAQASSLRGPQDGSCSS